MTVDPEALELLVVSIRRDKIVPLGPPPPGWPGEIEKAVVDAVFSIRARYGEPTTGVRRVVQMWQEHRGVGTKLDDLGALAEFESWASSQPGTGQRVAGRSKGAIVTEVAGRLVGAGCCTTTDFNPQDPALKHAWVGTVGLGPVTWSYLSMLVGHPDVKADTMICRYVSDAVGQPQISSPRALELMLAAAAALEVDPRALDHAVWQFQRRKGAG